jgi:hypothetical protein
LQVQVNYTPRSVEMLKTQRVYLKPEIFFLAQYLEYPRSQLAAMSLRHSRTPTPKV